MSTNSKIAIEQKDGSIVGVYCHNDGYLEGVGYTLVESWNDPAKLKQAIDLGKASCWGHTIGEKIDFDERHNHRDQICFYGRDRGEKDVGPTTYKDLQAYKQDEGFCSYIYLLKNTGEWVYSMYKDNTWLPLHPMKKTA